jgi:hypothetical protein
MKGITKKRKSDLRRDSGDDDSSHDSDNETVNSLFDDLTGDIDFHYNTQTFASKVSSPRRYYLDVQFY